MAFSGDNKYLATGSDDKILNLINLQSKTLCHKFRYFHECNKRYLKHSTTYTYNYIHIYIHLYWLYGLN